MTERWNVADAKRRFSEVMRLAVSEPQLIYNRERLVAAVVDPEMLEEFRRWRVLRGRSVAERFAEYRVLAAEEEYELEIPERRDRDNPFAEPEGMSD
jgi:hypothetical protein